MASGITKRMRVGVVMGGLASERPVSLETGAAALAALRHRGWKAVGIDAGRDLARVLAARRIDVVWNALHGKLGEDGAVQGLLEVLGVPYTGSGVLASALAMDKAVSKILFSSAGIPVGPYRCLRRATPSGGAASSLDEIGIELPLVVKPTCEGSSMGVSLVRTAEDLPGALETAFRYDPVVLVEKYLAGRELQVGMLDGVALGILEVVPRAHAFYDYETKYTEGMAEHRMPAPLDEGTAARVGDLAGRAYRVLGCEGHARVEFILTEDSTPYVLEVNTLPGMTSLSLLPEIARHAGIEFPELCERILVGARCKIPGPARPRKGRTGKGRRGTGGSRGSARPRAGRKASRRAHG